MPCYNKITEKGGITEKTSINNFNINSLKLLSENSISKVYKLCNGEILKMFNPNILDLYNNIGASMEKKILEAELLPDIPEIVIPNKAVYDEKDKFIAYTSNYIEGLNFGQYYDSLQQSDKNSLYFFASIFEKLENTISRANGADIVFPDLANPGNFIFDKNGNFKLIDYDGMQIKDNKSMVIARVLSSDGQYNKVSKYGNGHFLYTPELDKKSIIILYMIFVFHVKLTVIGQKSYRTGEAITLDYIFDYIGLEDNEFKNKISKIYNDNEKNEFITKDIYRLAEMYELRPKASIAKERGVCKYLIKKR